MNYLDQLEAMEFENTPPPPTAITAKSPYDSKDSTQGRQFSEMQSEGEIQNTPTQATAKTVLTPGEDQNTPTRDTAKTVLTPYGSNGSTQGRPFSEMDTAHEAAEERAAIVEYEAGLSRAQADYVATLAQDFYNHLFGPAKATGCCYAPRGRYCPVGLKLRGAYHEACANGGHPHGR